jgi:hypothetical protein
MIPSAGMLELEVHAHGGLVSALFHKAVIFNDLMIKLSGDVR